MISWQVLVGLIPLAISLVLNAFQLYRQRVYSRTVYNGVVGTFNSVGWLIARSMSKTRETSERLGQLRTDDNTAIMREFHSYSLETEWALRSLHEQLVAVAKTLREKDKRWQAGEFGYTQEEIKKFRNLFRPDTSSI